MPRSAACGSTSQTSASTTTNPNGQNFGFGITGASGGWTTVTATLPAGTTAYRFRYWTDGAVVEPGFAVDSINVGGTVDNATSTAGWTLERVPAARRRPVHRDVLPLLPGRVAQLHPQRHQPLRRVQLPVRQLAREAVLRRRAADLVPQLVGTRQQHVAAPGLRPDPADRRASRRRWSGRTARPPGASRWQTWDATFGVDANTITLSQVINPSRRCSKTYTAPPGLVVLRLVADRVLQRALPLQLGEDGRLRPEDRHHGREHGPRLVPGCTSTSSDPQPRTRTRGRRKPAPLLFVTYFLFGESVALTSRRPSSIGRAAVL